ncbi:MAG: LysM peptidoglycan-binding domain-containing protein [Saprospiraceae bacterium]|nr:LysM peptidoglycan-binding domain-containing protein [Saprospiraceae bacterium]
MNKVSLLFGLLFFSFTSLEGQQLFKSDSRILLQFDEKGTPYFEHTLEPGEYLYGISGVVGKTAKEVLAYNHYSHENQLKAGKTVKLPIDPYTLVKKLPGDLKVDKQQTYFIPVFYKVKKGDTVYRLVKVNLGEDTEDFCKRNKLDQCQWKLGMEVSVGWLALKGKNNSDVVDVKTKMGKYANSDPAILKKEQHQKSMETNQKLTFAKVVQHQGNVSDAGRIDKSKAAEEREADLSDEKEIVEVEAWVNSKGVAYWHPGHKSNSNKYVLHNSAELNSIIELYNPMLRRTIRAKVIGRIPTETYREDIDVVLSSGAAESLGALDSRFQVEMKFKK